MGGRTEAQGVAMFIPTLTGGGAERVLVNLLKTLPDHPRHLVLMDRQIAYDYDADLHVLAGQFMSGGPPLARIRILGENLARLGVLKRKLPVPWVSFTTWANILNVLSGGRGRTIVTSHNRESVNIAGRLGPLVRALVRYTYARADAVVAVSNAVKQDLVDTFGVPEGRITTIYNTIDLHEVQALREEPLDSTLARFLSGSSIVTAGSLKRQKGHSHLLRVFSQVKRALPEARLAILGEGPLGPSLTGLARDLGLRVHVAWDPSSAPLDSADAAFLGFRRNPFAIFARARLFAFSSLWEGFGNVLVEAMACGTPVVSTDCASGPREILAPEGPHTVALQSPEFASAGVLTPTFDGQDRRAAAPLAPPERLYADTLSRLLRDDDALSHYRAAGQRRASDFTLESTAADWKALLFDH
jgi:glycosyltransferase involved in cell wall biosynthesis